MNCIIDSKSLRITNDLNFVTNLNSVSLVSSFCFLTQCNVRIKDGLPISVYKSSLDRLKFIGINVFVLDSTENLDERNLVFIKNYLFNLVLGSLREDSIILYIPRDLKTNYSVLSYTVSIMST